MKKLLPILLCIAALPVHAQTLSPIISQYAKKAAGEFTVTNNALVPQVVTLESKSFTVAPDGKTVWRPLPDSITIRLSETSARLGPKESHTFRYQMECAQMPCWATIFATVTGLKTREGVKIAIHLPHTIYECPDKANTCRARVLKQWGVD